MCADLLSVVGESVAIVLVLLEGHTFHGVKGILCAPESTNVRPPSQSFNGLDQSISTSGQSNVVIEGEGDSRQGLPNHSFHGSYQRRLPLKHALTDRPTNVTATWVRNPERRIIGISLTRRIGRADDARFEGE